MKPQNNTNSIWLYNAGLSLQLCSRKAFPTSCSLLHYRANMVFYLRLNYFSGNSDPGDKCQMNKKKVKTWHPFSYITFKLRFFILKVKSVFILVPDIYYYVAKQPAPFPAVFPKTFMALKLVQHKKTIYVSHNRGTTTTINRFDIRKSHFLQTLYIVFRHTENIVWHNKMENCCIQL